MAQGPSDTILVAIRITLRIWESKIRILRIGGGLSSLSAFLSVLYFYTSYFSQRPISARGRFYTFKFSFILSSAVDTVAAHKVGFEFHGVHLSPRVSDHNRS